MPFFVEEGRFRQYLRVGYIIWADIVYYAITLPNFSNNLWVYFRSTLAYKAFMVGLLKRLGL